MKNTDLLIQQISIADVRPSPFNPRKTFEPGALAELAASITKSGVQVALLVRPLKGKGGTNHEIVFGERRWRSSALANKETVPCEVREMTDEQVREAQIVENLQRADVHPVEEAEAYRAIITANAVPLSDEDVAKRVGKPASYVTRRLKLLELIPMASQLFAQMHITVGHAELLARLTIVDQEKAVRFLLDRNGYIATVKEPTDKLLARKLKEHAEEVQADNKKPSGGEGVERIVEPTESELRAWIRTSVVLELKSAPWSLDDAELVPAAGACSECPKRTGANESLFAELTAEKNACTDAICFGSKHKAFVQITVKRAEEAGETLLKLSAKSGHKPLPKPLKEKAVIRNGQWMKAKLKSCPNVCRGLLVDDSSRWDTEKLKAGTILTVCIDQACKVHKHTTDRPSSRSGSNAPSESYEERERREKAEAAKRRAIEQPVLRAVYAAMLAKLSPAHLYLQSVVFDKAHDSAAAVCVAMGVKYPAPKTGNPSDWNHRDAAEKPLKEFLKTASLEQLHRVSFHALFAAELNPRDHELVHYPKNVRKDLFEGAAFIGVDAPAIAKRIEKELAASQAKSEPAAKPTEKPVAVPAKKKGVKVVAKKAAPKKSAQAKAKAKKSLAPVNRKRIVDAMRKRWAERRKAASRG